LRARGRCPRPPALDATWARALSRRGAGSCVLGETLQRADDVADRPGGDAGVKRRAVELGVAHQNLDHANIDAAFQKMGGEAVPQRMRRNALVDAGGLGGGVAGAIELARRERTDAVLPGKQPALRPRRPPPGAQQVEQLRSTSYCSGVSIARHSSSLRLILKVLVVMRALPGRPPQQLARR